MDLDPERPHWWPRPMDICFIKSFLKKIFLCKKDVEFLLVDVL